MAELIGTSFAQNSQCSSANETKQNQTSEISLDFVNKKLCEKLIQVIGTDEAIRNRQEMFIVQDNINNYGDVDSVSISGGSLAEGLNIKGSDEDTVNIVKNVSAVSTREKDKFMHNCTVILMDAEVIQPGYTKLLLPRNTIPNSYISNALVEIQGNFFVSSSKFRAQFLIPGKSEHGPCVVSDDSHDFANCLSSRHWPDQANGWIARVRSSRQMSNSLIEDITSLGCLLVPVGPKFCEEYPLLWRISFSLAERKLILTMNHTQILCYGLLKIFLKEVIEKEDTLKDLLCSYFLKTAVLWMKETANPDIWRLNNIVGCFLACLDEVIGWVSTCFCPNYFIPENNMFAGRIESRNNHLLLETLLKYRSENYGCLFRSETLKSFINDETTVSEAQKEADLDLLCFRTIHTYPCDVLNLSLMALVNAEMLDSTSKEFSFTNGVIKRMKALIHQGVAQLLSPTGSNKQAYRIIKQQLVHLVAGSNTDVGAGYTLLASFFHVHGRYKTCLRIIECIITRCSPDLLSLRNHQYTQRERDFYCDTYCGRNSTLHYKMRNATLSRIVMQDNSSIMPEEFQPEVQCRPLLILPTVVFAYCLQFLCYHHLGDVTNRQQSLNDLEQTVLNRYLILQNEYAHSLLLVGACYEVIGDKNEAARYYRLARDNQPPSRSAEYRLKRLGNEIDGIK